MKRVLLVADSAVTIEAIRRALRHAPELRPAGYANGRLAIGAVVAPLRPDIVLIDEMAGPDRAVARISEAHSAAPRAKVILLTSSPEAPWVSRAIRAGAGAVVSKTLQSVTLGVLVREVAAGSVFNAYGAEAAPERQSGTHDLTMREREILALLVAGASNRRIATSLFVTEQTVKFHLSNVYRKLGVANRTAASHYVHIHRLLDDPSEPLPEVAAIAA
jgi:DNA-binding NarL/FixJ family response regulator